MFRVQSPSSRPGGNEDPAFVEPMRDSGSGQRNNLFAPEAFGVWTVGVVTASYAYTNCYRVTTDLHGVSPMCVLLAGSLSPVGAKEATLLPVGTRVLVVYPRSMPCGLILGVVPAVDLPSGMTPGDSFVPMHLGGFRYDAAHTYPLQRPDASGILNFHNGRPVDILPGDWAVMNDLGAGLLLGKTLLRFRAADLAALDLFLTDRLVRITSENFEHFGTFFERHLKNDEGECSEVSQLTPYPWEGLGLYERGDALRSASFEWAPGDTEASLEPTSATQAGLFRLHEYKGYLGDLRRVIVSAPDPNGNYPEDGANTHPGLFEEHVGIDGAFTLKSARRILFSKTCMIPVPTRIRAPEDPQGDRPGSDYRSAGEFGDGPEHAKPEYEFVDDRPSTRVLQLEDVDAYASRWYASTAIRRHTKDFLWPKSSETKLGSLVGSSGRDMAGLSSSFELPLPQAATLRVDHRSPEAQYYQSTSFMGLLDDGSIVQQDGYGAQISMSGGNIRITAPGDIRLEAGRNVVVMGGRDAVLRCGKSMDLTAATGDVRIKAEANLHQLAGNGGHGGIVLESRAATSTQQFSGVLGEDVRSAGVIVKTASAPLLLFAGDIYARTVAGGAVRIDADGGNGRIQLSGTTIEAFLTNSFALAFGTSFEKADKPKASVVFRSADAIIGTPLVIGGTTVVTGRSGRSNLMVSGGIQMGGQIVSLTNSDAFIQALGARNREMDAFDTALAKTVNSIKEQLRDDPSSIGNPEFIRQLTVTLRNAEQYGSSGDDFRFVEAPWQRLYRLQQTGVPWNEPAVKSGAGEDTYPWPGATKWDGDALFLIDGTYYDYAAQRAIDEDPESSSVLQAVKPSEKYLITAQS